MCLFGCPTLLVIILCVQCLCVCLFAQHTVHHAALTLATLLCVCMSVCACACVSVPTLSYDDGLLRLIGAACCLSDPPLALAQWNSALHCFDEWGTWAQLFVCVCVCASTYTHMHAHILSAAAHTLKTKPNKQISDAEQPAA